MILGSIIAVISKWDTRILEFKWGTYVWGLGPKAGEA